MMVSSVISQTCTLTELEVGEIPVLEQSVPVVALTLARIFPPDEFIDYMDERFWT